MRKTHWLPATSAAARLGLSREATVRRLQRGVLRGRITPDGFWQVDADDIPRYLKTERAAQGTTA